MKKVINKVCWVLLVVLIWNVGTAVAQNRTETIAAADDPYKVEKVKFKNEAGQVVSTYDIAANNPFAAKVQAAKALQSGSANARASQGNKVKDFVSNSDQYLESDAGDYEVGSAALTSSIIYTSDMDVRGVVQNIVFLSKYEDFRGVESEVTIFDDSGKVVNKVRLVTNCGAAAITENLRIMAVLHGGEVDHNGYQLFEQGVSIYDLETGNEIKRITIEPSYFQVLFPSTFSNNNILIEMKSMSSYKVFVVNSIEREIYSREFSKDLWYTVKEATASGFITNDGSTEGIIPFTDDFDKTSF